MWENGQIKILITSVESDELKQMKDEEDIRRRCESNDRNRTKIILEILVKNAFQAFSEGFF